MTGLLWRMGRMIKHLAARIGWTRLYLLGDRMMAKAADRAP
jgi:hypothetical protein